MYASEDNVLRYHTGQVRLRGLKLASVIIQIFFTIFNELVYVIVQYDLRTRGPRTNKFPSL